MKQATYCPVNCRETEYYDEITAFARQMATGFTYQACRPGLFDCILLGTIECQYGQKKGQFNLNHPLMDVASKMPLLISQQKKCTNIPEVANNDNAMFHKFKGVGNIFTTLRYIKTWCHALILDCQINTIRIIYRNVFLRTSQKQACKPRDQQI